MFHRPCNCTAQSMHVVRPPHPTHNSPYTIQLSTPCNLHLCPQLKTSTISMQCSLCFKALFCFCLSTPEMNGQYRMMGFPTPRIGLVAWKSGSFARKKIPRYVCVYHSLCLNLVRPHAGLYWVEVDLKWSRCGLVWNRCKTSAKRKIRNQSNQLKYPVESSIISVNLPCSCKLR